jgi:hypothetical protein
MGFLERFRPQPKWKHGDPAVRLAAVQELGDREAEALAAVARSDADPRVRRAAVARLLEPALLAEIGRADEDEQVREEAFRGLLEAAQEDSDEATALQALGALVEQKHLALVAKAARLEAVSRAAVSRLTDSRALGAAARQSKHESARMEAVSRITDKAELASVAARSEQKEVALAALERIDDVPSLRSIAAKARTKAAVRRAKAMLQALDEAAQAARTETVDVSSIAAASSPPLAEVPAADPRADIAVQICAAAEALGSAPALDEAAGQLVALRARWEDLGPDAGAELAGRFEAACATVEGRLARRAADLVAEQQRAEEVARLSTARVSLCERAEALAAIPIRRVNPIVPTPVKQEVKDEAAASVEGQPVSAGHDETAETAARHEAAAVESQTVPEPGAPPDEVLNTVALLRAEWDALPAMPGGPEATALFDRFERACAGCFRRHEEWQAGQARRARMAALVSEATALAEAPGFPVVREAREQWAAIRREWMVLAAAEPDAAKAYGVAFALAAERLSAREEAGRAERMRQQLENLARRQRLCEHAEAALESTSLTLRDGERISREVRAALDALGPLPSRQDRSILAERLKAIQTALGHRLRELRELDEWQRWANASVQEDLCARMEALLSAEDVEEAARQSGELQQRWKQVAAAPREAGETLWLRFKAAREAVRARSETFFASQAEERDACLKRKEELCVAVEALAESTDWIRTAEAIKKYQSEWKAVGPVPRGYEKALWERFRKACDRFFSRRHEDLSRRKQEWAGNLARKQQLCEQAEALAESTEWASAIEGVRRLQAEWKTVGAVRKSRSELVWQRFRAACDRLYQRYEQRDQLAAATKTADREEVCQAIEELAAAVDPGSAEEPADVVSSVQALRNRWQHLGPLTLLQPDQAAVFSARYGDALVRIAQAYPASFAGTDLDLQANARRMEELCQKVERVVDDLASGAVPDESPAETLARQLREALAANTIGGRSDEETRWRSATEEVRNAQAAWDRIGPVPGATASGLWHRFDSACRRFFAERPRSAGGTSGRGLARSGR